MELLNKLNYKQQNEIIILNAPKSFENETEEIKKKLNVIVDEDKIYGDIEFVLVFVKNHEEIEKYAESILTRISKNALIWFAYPKEFSLDDNWEIIRDYQLEPVRQISLCSGWAALRFRPYKNARVYARSDNSSHHQEEKIKTKKKIEFY